MTAAAALDQPAIARWRNAIFVGFGVGGIATSAWGPRLPALRAELGISTATIGLLVAGATVGAIGGLVVATPVARLLGGRRGVAGALLVIAVALAVLGTAAALRWVPLVAVGFVIVGFGIGTLDILLNVEGSAVERQARRTLMPLMHGGWSIGVAAGAGVGAACAALGVPPAEQFLGEGIAIALAALVVSRPIPPGVRHQERPARPPREAVREWLQGWADGRLLLIGLVMLGAELGEGSANNWLTLAVHQDHGEGPAVAALFFATFATGEALARLLGGPVVERLGRVRAVRVTTALGVVGVVLFVLGQSPWLVLPGIVLWAVGVSMGFPLGMSAAAESGPDPAARVSVVASIGYFANLAGPPVIGLLAESAGLLHSLWLIAASLAMAFLAAGAMRPATEART